MFDRALGSILRACVRETEPAAPAVSDALHLLLHRQQPDALSGLADAAEYHGIGGYVHRHLGDEPALPPLERTRLAELRQWAVMVHMRSILDLSWLRRVLGDADVPWLVVKGPALAVPAHGSADLRSYGDLDVLVRPRDLAITLEALESAGATVLDRNWILIRDEMKGEVHVMLPSGTLLDLHWHLHNSPWRRRAFPMVIESLFERSRTIDVDGTNVTTLHEVDTLVYVAMHAVLSGADRLIWVKDVERLTADAPDIAAVLDRARQWRSTVVLSTALDVVDVALGLPESGRALRAALPSGRPWTSIVRGAWRRSPVERQDGSGSLGRIVARSTRTTPLSSVVTLLGRSVQRAQQRVTGHDPTRPPETDPGSDRFDAGGPSVRHEYLQRVARQR